MGEGDGGEQLLRAPVRRTLEQGWTEVQMRGEDLRHRQSHCQTEVANPLLPHLELRWDGAAGWDLKLYASTRAWSLMTIRGHGALTVAGHIVPGVNVLSPRQPQSAL